MKRLNLSTSATRSSRVGAAAMLSVSLLALVGCGGSSTDADSPAETTAAAAGAADGAITELPKGSGELNLANWTDYTSPELLTKFEKDTGIKVNLSTYDSNESLLAKMQAGDSGYDVVVPSDYMVQQMAALDLLENVGAASLPNGKNIDPAFLDAYFDKGRQYTVPYLFGTTGIAVDTKQVKNPPKTWKEFFNPTEETAGKIGILNDQVEVLNAALKATGGTPCTNDPGEWEAVSALLKNFKSKVQVINSDDVIGRMSTGEQAMHMMWNGAFHRAQEKNKDLVYVFAGETINLWQDNLAIPKGAKNLDNAKIFLNFMADPANSAIAVNAQGYGSGITGAGDQASDALKANPAVNPPADLAALATPTPPCDAETILTYDKVWTEFKA
jgi:spermidine/putrescine transport system substrate-binding protein